MMLVNCCYQCHSLLITVPLILVASDVYMTDAPPPYPGMMPAPPMYTPPQNAGVQQMPAAYYDPNKPNTAYTAATAPPSYEDQNMYEKKRL